MARLYNGKNISPRIFGICISLRSKNNVMQKQPLAEILRPHSIEGYIGQEHLMGEGAVLRTAIESGNIQSMIFWGPPGVGKTTLALLIA